MAKSVVLAEKPSVARDIARVLKCHKKGNGYLEGDRYIVTWALGHLVTHATPEQYDKKYQKWTLEDLPIIPNSFKLVPIRQTTKQYNAVKAQLNRKDVNEVIIATDAGREGELVARWILERANIRKPIKRLWISSVTDKAIQDGFRQLKDGRAYDNLYAAAVARAEADWIVGINATRALTVKHNAQLSTGRVQTPTLAMIRAREEEIQNFKPKTYYGLEVQTDDALFVWQDAKGNTRTFDESKMKKMFAQLENEKDAEVVHVETKPKKTYAKPLFDLTELQKEAFHRWKWSAKETLNTLQNLYERHKIVTYPRTDSKHLTSDMQSTLLDRIRAVNRGTYRDIAQQIARTKPLVIQKGVVNDKLVTDHHAIIPTEEPPNYMSLSGSEKQLYDLITARFLATFLGPAEFEQMTVTIRVGDETFKARGEKMTKLGHRAVTESTLTESTLLPSFSKGQKLPIRSLHRTSGETKPPARFNEGTLLAAMENPSAFMQGESKQAVQTLQETGGIGTVATRAEIIERLFQMFVIEKKGNELYTTSKGRQLLNLVPEELKSPALTAEWETNLTKIAHGKMKKEAFIQEMIDFSKKTVNNIKNDTTKFKHDNVSGKTCPDCGKFLLRVNGKRGVMLVCQDRECGHRQNVSQQTNARCPNCRKKLQLRGEGEGRIFVCSCGHREKLSSFEKRRKKSTNAKADKRTVQKYMKQQDDEPVNTALADALKQLFDK
ncbi:DNA topoisomerase III [Savagea sp. SN6]|uniref:DNA topoisomerase 3 n=1 Tax=Savagea serpentis TaxID=2785297 RepID=A0A8J7KES7_9BACL|nr:DNA topoisomerase III [Savagea serpentis]MBF4501461.1 DNA topoisomerase III [Savagea serpentis]